MIRFHIKIWVICKILRTDFHPKNTNNKFKFVTIILWTQSDLCSLKSELGVSTSQWEFTFFLNLVCFPPKILTKRSFLRMLTFDWMKTQKCSPFFLHTNHHFTSANSIISAFHWFLKKKKRNSKRLTSSSLLHDYEETYQTHSHFWESF